MPMCMRRPATSTRQRADLVENAIVEEQRKTAMASVSTLGSKFTAPGALIGASGGANAAPTGGKKAHIVLFLVTAEGAFGEP